MYRAALMLSRAHPMLPIAWLLGLGIAVLMACTAGLGRDQQLMLELGRAVLAQPHWPAFGMPTSAGGLSPGGLTGVLVALPLAVWNHPVAASLFTLVLHALAFVLLVRCCARALGPLGVACLTVFAWLTPWQIYFSSHIWNANFMYVFAVLHLASLLQLARRGGFWTSALHVLLLGLSIQVHTSGFVLVFCSALMSWRGGVRFDPRGVIAGGALVALAYMPWLLSVPGARQTLPGEHGYPLRSLLTLAPWLKGALHALRMASLGLPERMLDLDFRTRFGAAANAWVKPLAIAWVLAGQISLPFAAWTYKRLLVGAWRRRHRVPGVLAVQSAPHRRAFLRRYATAMLVALLFAFAVSPTTPMFWQALVAQPAAAIAVTLHVLVLARSRLRSAVRLGARVLPWYALTASLLVGLGATMFRMG